MARRKPPTTHGLAVVDKPAGVTSHDVVAMLRKRFDELGMEVIGNTPAEFAAAIKAETPQWAKVIREAGIKAE